MPTNYELLKETAKRNKVYGFFSQVAEHNAFFNSINVEKTTIYRKEILKKSETSLSFKDGNIQNIFGINDSHFAGHYNKTVNGEGNEKMKIHTLHSSSLISLLCFYKVSADTPISFSTIVNNNPIEFRFDTVDFEYENKVKRGGRSSIDIKLTGIQSSSDEGIKATLFLESKFSEYLKFSNCLGNISEQYRDDYDKIFKTLSFPIKFIIGKDLSLKLISIDSKKHYFDGIKQMVSHYIGLCSYCKRHPEEHVFLATIAFDFENSGINDSRMFASILNDYSNDIKSLSNILNQLPDKPKNLFILDNIFTYQEVFNNQELYNLDSYVKDFYNLQKN